MNDNCERLRRFRDLKIVGDLEAKCVLDPELRSLHGGRDPEVWEKASEALFGIKRIVIWSGPLDDESDEDVERFLAAEAAFCARYADAFSTGEEMLGAFAVHGWDVSDGYGHPLYVMEQFAIPLLAAILGDYGAKLPAAEAMAEAWGADLAAEARRFRNRRG